MLLPNNGDSHCGRTLNTPLDGTERRAPCCVNEPSTSYGDCDGALNPSGPGIHNFYRFVNNEADWLNNFHKAWRKATLNGVDTPLRLQSGRRLEGDL